MKTTMFLGGALVLLAVGLAGVGLRLNRAEADEARWRAEADRAAERMAQLETELERLRPLQVDQAELTHLRESDAARTREIARLRSQLGAFLRSQTNAPTPDPAAPQGADTTDGNNRVTGAVARWLNAAGERSLEAQLNRARERLNLSPEQEQSLREITRNALRQGGENLQKLLAGQATFEDVPTTAEWAKSLEKDVLSALTPDQRETYEKYRREDLAANARLMANGELLRAQNDLGLSTDQQDQMFAVLYDQTLAQLDPDPDRLAASPRNPVRAAELQTEERLRALEGVLTPSQLEAYRKMQESNLAILRGVLGRLGAK
jgi:hypothetical protein